MATRPGVLPSPLGVRRTSALQCWRNAPVTPVLGAPHNNRRNNVAAETYEGSFYCVKCKDHRDAEGAVSVNDKGTRIAKAKCPVCGTNLTRFLPKK